MNILIFLPNYIGDILMTTPSIRVLKKFFSKDKIFCVVDNKYKDLLDENPNIDYVIAKKNNLWEQFFELRDKHFDIIILFRTTFRNSFLTFLLKPKFSIGLKEELSKIFLTKALRKDFARSYRSECLMLVEEILNNLGLKYIIQTEELKKLDFYGWDKIEVKSSLEKILVDNKIDIQKHFIVVNPKSTRETKNLTIEQNIELIKILKNRFLKYEIIVTGGEKDFGFTNYILKEINVKSLVGKLSLKQLAYLLSKTKVFISPDTGPAFVAQSVNCNTIMFFTSTSPDKYAPYNDNVKYYYNPVLCSPCYRNFCNQKIKNKCIKEVEIEKIVDLVEQFL